ncbi:ABC transporter substrate-binding protein [Herbaspirillum rhizosphaerae]|uniref:ABC transporter substrate-binding protein n=1 Tax=Herbaspirillum rhizosphaerae TaxID=346179 RepID=UPI00142F3782|nr:ABC transporter substrate-binding protein [Herbaspirillum rhizosphaerae]
MFRILPLLLAWSFSPVHAETGVTNTRILLGQSAGLSGPTAQMSRQLLIGARAYFNKINKQGGVHGRRIELVTRDDRYIPSLAAYNTRQLIENDKVFALFGFVGLPTSQAALSVAAKARVPFFAPMTGGASVYSPFNRYVFTLRASYADEYLYALRNLSSMGLRKFALVYQQDQYGVSVKQAVESSAREEAVDLVTIDIDMDGRNVEPVVDKVLAARSEVVMLLSANYLTNARIVRALRGRGYLGQFFAISFVGQKALAEELGDLARGMLVTQVVPFPWRVSMPLVAEYRQCMSEAGYQDLTFSSLEGYIAARVLVEGLRRARRDLTREKLIRALESINVRNYDGGGYAINFSPDNHNASLFVDMAAMTSGARFLN